MTDNEERTAIFSQCPGRNILVAADVKNPPCGPKGGEVKKQDRKS